MQFWCEYNINQGRPVRRMVYLFVAYFCGFGYLTQLHSAKPYFGEQLHMNKKIIDTFFKDFGGYILHNGNFIEAKKHGLIASSQRTIKFLHQMQMFQTKKKFDRKKYDAFLVKHKLSDLEVREYAYQTCTVVLFTSLFQNIVDFKPIEKNIDSYQIKSVSGKKYTMNIGAIHVDPVTDEEFNIFIESQYKNTHMGLLTQDQQRSGMVIYINNKNEDINKLKNICTRLSQINYMNIKNVQNLLNKHSITYQIQEYKNITRQVTNSARFLFQEKINIYYDDDDHIFIPLTTDIQTSYFRLPEGYSLEKLKTLCLFNKQKNTAWQMSIDIAQDINIGKNVSEQLTKIASKSDMFIDDNNYDKSNYFKLNTNQSCTFFDMDDIPSIFVCKKIHRGEKVGLTKIDENISQMRNLSKSIINNQFNDKFQDTTTEIAQLSAEEFIQQMLNFWIQRAHV